jgi:heavy metal translocating P-type ATPase
MTIPYTVERLLPGRLCIRSEYLKYSEIPEYGLRKFLLQKDGTLDVRIKKRTGYISIEYDTNRLKLGEFFSSLKLATPQKIEKFLAQPQNGRRAIRAESNDHKAKNWFIASTIGLAPFVIRSALPSGILTVLTLALATPIFKKALSALKNRKIDVHLLDSSALALSTLRGGSFTSMLMVWLLSLGDLIEDHTQGKAKKEIEKLLMYEDESAWLVSNGEHPVKVPVSQIKKGDRVVVYTGEKITVDGLVYDGEALVNQASLTGEPNPALKKRDDKIYAGTFVEDGKIYVVAEKIGDETAVAKIVQIIEESINEPIETQKSAEKMANKFVIPTFLTSGGIYTLTSDLNRTVSTLTFDYHTGIHVSTPASIMSHMALAAKRGILIKSGRHLEILHNVDTIVFDKTGTLTIGHPAITEVIPYEVSEKRALKLAASLEQRLTHPVAKSIVNKALESGIKLIPRKESTYHRGLGISADIDGSQCLIGSTKFMEKKGIQITEQIADDVRELHERGASALYLVQRDKIISLIGFADPLRLESKQVVETLHTLGREVILCTGDNEGAAEVVANKLGINTFHSRAFPDEKARIIRSLKSKGKRVAFLGDGVNDSPALSVADIGISINSGADIAIEIADVVIGNDLRHLIDAINISDMALRNIKHNYRINNIANTAGMIGAVSGVISPVMATAINNGVTVVIGMNAVRPLWNDYNADLNRNLKQIKMGGGNHGKEDQSKDH